MASGYTTNYGLCQWQSEDKFLREEFNQDNEKIDAALKAAEDRAAEENETVQAAAQKAKETADRALSGLAAADYNIYNLLLQNEYEGKYTRYKKALIYDGFLDGSGVSGTSGGLLLGEKGPTLCRTGQSSIDLGYGSTTNQSSSSIANQTITGGGRLTSFTFRIRNNQNEQRSASIQWTVTVNGKEVATGTKSTNQTAAFATLTVMVSLSPSVVLGPGDVLDVEVYSSGSGWQYYLSSGGSGLGGVLTITPVSGTTGSLTTVSRSLPASQEIIAWVRHTGGQVTFSAGGQALEKMDTRETADVQGTACRETQFRLPGGLGAGSNQFQLGVTLDTGDNSALILDYGVALL